MEILNQDSKKILWYANQIYGPNITNYNKDKTIMFIHTPWDSFKIFLKDKERFGYYTIYHKNKCTNGWHKQRTCNKLLFAIYVCIVHGFNKECDIKSHQEDYQRFIQDAKKYYKEKGE